MEGERIEGDFLVIGSGLAGLNFALRVADAGKVLVITKKERSETNTNYAQAGIAAAIGEDDSPSIHFQDTVRAGCGISNEEAVRIMVEEGPSLVMRLVELGVEFTKKKLPDGREVWDLWKEGGHSRRRILHAGDFTGQHIERVLIERAKEKENIKVFEDFIAVELIVEDGRCLGAWVFDEKRRKIIPFIARVVFLATGGGAQVYLHSTNPSIATGDGISIAWRAGALIANLEFVQFHPTSVYSREKRERNFLISEAVRGEGAVLLNLSGERFMEKYDERKELAPRDVVARAIDKELKERGEEYVLLDLSPIGEKKIKEKFPNIYRHLLENYGIDITRNPIPVVPAAHYLCGGVKTDVNGRTSIRGLYAAGEVACTGVHGANRLASNSLLEALVFSDRAARDALEFDEPVPLGLRLRFREGKESIERIVLVHMRERIKKTMCDLVGIVRNDYRLSRALRILRLLNEEISEMFSRVPVSRATIELRSLSDLAYLITLCASMRKESRGLHYNTDHPEPRKEWERETIIG